MEVGVSANYNTLHYESEGASFNDHISYDFGFQTHVLFNHDLTKKIKVQYGLEYFFFSYDFNLPDMQHTDSNGLPTGNYYKFSMIDDFSTSYLTAPIRLRYFPFPERYLFVIAGPEISYKIGYSNGTIGYDLYSGENKKLPESYTETYNVPELANDFLLSGVFGVGFNLENLAPMSVELKAKHSVTPYLSGDNFLNSWIRSLSLSISYRL